jgi:hypothetical protein
VFRDIIQLILESAEGAFLEVGAFVGATLLLFGYINYKKSGAFVAAIEKSKKWQPVLGALLGLIPGCGGAIFIMPLFFKGAVSFGTVVATLIATMGDSAFVIIASQPLYYLLVSLLSFIAAVITGYIVDNTSIGENIIRKYNLRMKTKIELEGLHRQLEHPNYKYAIDDEDTVELDKLEHIGHEEGDEIDILLHHKTKGHQQVDTLGYKFTHGSYYIYWIMISIALVFGTGLLFQIELDDFLPNVGLILGGLGTLFSIVMMIMGKKFIGADTHEESELKVKSLRETLIHNAQETAFVITWVFVGFIAYEVLVLLIGGGDYLAGEASIEGFLLATGIISILIGALVGLVPGCGPQIIFVALFSRGLIPFAALFANSISQDGDALFPIIAIDRRAAMWATIITTIPAIVFGLMIYWFELNVDFSWITRLIAF